MLEGAGFKVQGPTTYLMFFCLQLVRPFYILTHQIFHLTLSKILKRLFTVTLLTVTMETLHSQTLKNHVTGQVINSEILCKY